MSHYITLGTPILVAVIAGAFARVDTRQKRRFDLQDRALSSIVTEVVQAALDARDAKAAADVAAVRSLPTSNGFASGVRSDLAFIKGELGGIRADHRHLAEKFDDHVKETRRG